MFESKTAGHVAELSAKIKPVRIAMFTTVDQYGHLTSQPMTNQDIDDQGGLWFYTSTSTHLWENIGANPAVNVSYVDPADSLYVSVSGNAERVVDRAKIKELWNPLVAAWFPHGVDDPHLVLVRVAARTAEYWDSHSSKMVGLFDMAKAALTGEPPEVEPGEHGKIRI